MEEAISSEQSEPIFQAAADKFQEVAATGEQLLVARARPLPSFPSLKQLVCPGQTQSQEAITLQLPAAAILRYKWQGQKPTWLSNCQQLV